MEDKKELTWPDFKRQVFEHAMKIVGASNCSRFKLLGYSFLDIRLILYFDDCNQVFDFVKGEFEVEITKFFTEDKKDDSRVEEHKRWKYEFENDKPEVK
jgi:hypothetical protein